MNQQESGEKAGLKRGAVSFWGSFAQSVGLICPTAGIALVVPAVAGIVGPVSWLAWLVGLVAILCIAYAIWYLSRRYTSTGGLYPVAGKAGGSVLGYMTAFGAIVWLLIAGPAMSIQVGIYVMSFLGYAGLHFNTPLVVAIFSLLTIFGAAGLSYKGIKIATETILWIEVVTTAAVLFLFVAILCAHPGGAVYTPEFHFQGLNFSTILAGIVLVVWAFGGFESATILGQEAGQATHNIPMAVMASITFAGILYIISAYVIVLGFSHAGMKALEGTLNAYGDLSVIYGMKWFAYIITAGICVTTFGANIALYNAGSRMLYTLPKEGWGTAWLTKLSRYQTPINAISIFFVVNVVCVLVIWIARFDPVNSFDHIGTLSGFGTIIMYLGISIAAAIFIFRRKGFYSALGGLVCLVGAAISLYGLYVSFVPFPTKFPDYLVPSIFIGLAVIALGAAFFILGGRKESRPFQGKSIEENTAA